MTKQTNIEKRTISHAFLELQGVILSVVISRFLCALTFQYGWNNIISETFGLPELNFWQSMGINLILTLIVRAPLGPKIEKSAKEIILTTIAWYVFLFILIWFVAKYI